MRLGEKGGRMVKATKPGQELLKYFVAIIKMKMLSRKLAKCHNRTLLAVIRASQALTRKLYCVLESFGDLSKCRSQAPPSEILIQYEYSVSPGICMVNKARR